MITKVFKTGLALVAIIAALSLSGCKNDNGGNGNDPNKPDDPENPTLRFENALVLLERGTTATLKLIDDKQDAGQESTRYSSSNPKVATVANDGVVTANADGEAVITATRGMRTAQCTVRVSTKLEALSVKVEGTINETELVKDQKMTITFNRFPVNTAEFTKVRDQIGSTPAGPIVLQIMAMGMYLNGERNDAEQCVKLCNVNSNINNIKEGFRRLRQESNRPYQPAAYLQGATPENGYNPTENPYTVDVRIDPVYFQYPISSDDLFACYYLPLVVMTKGKDLGNIVHDEKGNVLTDKNGNPLKAVNQYDQIFVVKSPNKELASACEGGKFYAIAFGTGMVSQVKAKKFTENYNGLKPWKK